jgi:4-amino-4-deoxy-L-arabinose transferase-like glycosyltransferase
VAALLSLYAVLSWTASLRKGVSFDEGQQLAVGYNLWLRNDYRIEGANGDLIKRWATLPYLWSRPNFPDRSEPAWQAAEPYELGHRFFFDLGNRPEALLWQGRAMMALLGVATGWLVFLAARELFGRIAGLIAVGLFAFSPNMLAFGGIVSTDMSITLTLFGTTWCVWRLLHELTPGRLLASLAFTGLLVLAKMTAVVIVPIAVVLAAVRLAGARPWIVRWRAKTWLLGDRRRQVWLVVALVGLHAAAGWSAIWAHYGFRYAASPDPADPRLRFRPFVPREGAHETALAVVQWAREARMLPEGFCVGVEALSRDYDQLPAFMEGRWKIGGWRSFFPYAIWVKTQPSLFLLLALAGWAWWRARRGPEPPPGGTAWGRAPPPYALTPWLALVAVYLVIAMAEDINLGHRHVLPIYPALYVLAGAVALAGSRRFTWPMLAVAVLLGWRVADSVAARPHYLAYFGPQAGGTESGYKRLVDSSLDWGMSLPSLRRWLDANNPGGAEPVFLAYFGTDSPEYHGIESTRLPGFYDRRGPLRPYPLRPGYYAISATLLQGLYLVAIGQWNYLYEEVYRKAVANIERFEATSGNPAARDALLREHPIDFWRNEYLVHDHFRFARLCAWLRHQGEPPHRAGHAIFIWKLGADDLAAAVLGPPVELAPPSAEILRRFNKVK